MATLKISTVRNIVLFTKPPCFSKKIAIVNKTNNNIVRLIFSGFFRNVNHRPVKKWFFGMVQRHVFGLTKYYKVFNSVIKLVFVNVMNYLSITKLSSYVFFNKVSMFKNPNPLSCYSFVSIFTNSTIFYIRIIWGIIKRTMSPPPFIVWITNTKTFIFNLSKTVVNFTNHINYYSKLGEDVSI